MLFNFYKYFVSITYGITVCNEHAELDKLLSCLTTSVDNNDEIIVLQDITNKDERTSAVIKKYRDKIRLIETKLDNDFASFKNKLISNATKKFLFQIDADELPKAGLLQDLKRVLFKYGRKHDCFLVPRINIVNGYSQAHAKKWKWMINDQGYINFPDPQPRIIRLGGGIKWKNKVHEVFDGVQKPYHIADRNYSRCLLHVKDIKRQEKQNDFYDTLDQ